ncbi:MAG TPA: glycoside hydrolase family 15 protein [Gemmatimonadales bacterium]|nr:glycoside hydrolase family 15 protein [Gemmatimonadales bacterium]
MKRHRRIEEHAVIGDLHTIALVAVDGTISFLCAPFFDSPSVFASLLDPDRGGSFELAAAFDEPTHSQLYLPDTNVLLTRFLDDRGVAEVSDFMPVTDGGVPHHIVRRAKAVLGEVPFVMRCAPRFDYGRATHTIERTSEGIVFSCPSAGIAMRLRTSVPVKIEGADATARFVLRAGETASFILEMLTNAHDSPCGEPQYVTEAFKATTNFWRAWVARADYRGRWREMVMRSALALKLLTSQKHGSIVAAPTFGLPEQIGGARNWDYRYTWIRDASFTLYGLMRLGYTDESAAFMQWVEARCAELEPDGSMQIMYGLDGRHDLPEEELPHLSGYLGSRPVRIGNGAATHLQLDIYGELLDAIYLYDKYGEPISFDLWANVRRLIDWVCENWRQPDEGIWEVRGGRREFLYSKVLCWVAIDRAIRIAVRRSLPAPHARWHTARDAIHADIVARFWDPVRKTFVQFPGSNAVDASSLLMPLVRFISPTDPRWLSTLRAIEQSLVADSLVYRYRVDDEFSDGLPAGEGTFSMCSFWYVECLARMGDVQKARHFMEKMLGYANHVGLYGEELGPRAQHLGNFPQAFTHVALISAAYDLDRRLSKGS